MTDLNTDTSNNEQENVKKLTIKKILNDKYNKAEFFNEDDRKKIAKIVFETYETDKNSRIEKEQRWEDILEIVKENKIEDVVGVDENRARIIYPLIKDACKKWATEAYPLLMKDGEIVKAKAIGNDKGEVAINPIDQQPMIDPATQQPVFKVKPNKKLDKAQRRVEFENFYLLNKIEGYEKGFDELLYRLPMLGTYFKEITFDTILKETKVEVLFPQNVIVNINAVENKYTIRSRKRFYNYNDIIAKQKSGVFLDIDLKADLEDSVEVDTEEVETEGSFARVDETPQLFIEQHRWLDLDQDGFMEPYIVIIHKASQKLLGIYARFTNESIIRDGGSIVNIKAREYFVKYDFFPTTDGAYYCDGLGDLLFHTNNVTNTILNQLVDAGTLANKSGGFISKSFKQRAGNMELGIGKWKFVNMFGINLRDAILPIDHKEPSVVLFSLLQFILTSAKDLIGLNPAFSQDMNPNIAPTTMMALVNEGAKEFKAVYKRVYRSLKKEINLIEDIIRDNIDDVFSTMYIEVLDDEEANFKEDFDAKSYDVIPVADVNMTTSFEKNAKVRAMIEISGLPQFVDLFKRENLLRDILMMLNYPNINTIIQTPPPPAPDPALKIKEMELQLKAMQIQSKTSVDMAKDNSEKLRIKIADLETRIKLAEGALKAKALDYELAQKEADVENTVASSINQIAQANEHNAKAGATTKESEATVEQLYEPKGK